MERRHFLTKTAVAAGATAVALADAPNVIAQQRYQWRMSTTWTPALDVLQGAAQKMAKMVDDMSGGRLKIQVFAGGELMPPFGCFDACSQGTIESFMGAPYYWAGKDAGFQWFSAVPFGLNPNGMMAWYLYGDGLKLWEEAYAPLSLVPRPGPSTGVQMMGWFRRKINTTADYKGLKMRIPGLGGKIVAAAGVLQGRTMTTVAKCAMDAEQGGARYVDEACVRDGNLVTARTWNDNTPFMKTFVEMLKAARR